jgi:hypothetical protein
MSKFQAGKGPKRRKGENSKKFDSGWDLISWSSKSSKKEAAGQGGDTKP